MIIEIKAFDWDEHNLKKLLKHRVAQEEAEELFYIAPLIDEGAYDKAGEKRYRCLGRTESGRLLAAFFTIRGKRIRLITVRSMRKKEKEVYAKEKGS